MTPTPIKVLPARRATKGNSNHVKTLVNGLAISLQGGLQRG